MTTTTIFARLLADIGRACRTASESLYEGVEPDPPPVDPPVNWVWVPVAEVPNFAMELCQLGSPVNGDGMNHAGLAANIKGWKRVGKDTAIWDGITGPPNQYGKWRADFVLGVNGDNPQWKARPEIGEWDGKVRDF